MLMFETIYIHIYDYETPLPEDVSYCIQFVDRQNDSRSGLNMFYLIILHGSFHSYTVNGNK